MGIPVGILLLVLGAIAAYFWRDAVWIFARGLTVFSLFFWGIAVLIAALARKKAHRGMKRGLNDEVSEFENESDSP